MPRSAWPLWTLLAASLPVLTGCPSGRTTGNRDAGADASSVEDGGAVDAGTDAGSFDAGFDAGPPPCDCTPLPETCTPPALDAPAFTPSGTDAIEQLMQVIACAQTSLHIAMYESDRQCIVDAIAAQVARTPALQVRIVLDGEHCGAGLGQADCVWTALDAASDRVSVVADNRTAFMHHKWIIADGTRLWISSGNFTQRSYCVDHNDGLVLEQTEIVQRFEQVFQRMYTDGMYGPVAPQGETTGGIYGVYTSPETPTTSAPAWFGALATAASSATTSIDVFTNAWTRTEISDAILAARAANPSIRIRVIVPGLYADDAPAQALLAAGVEVRVANVHAKIMILDGDTVVTGSANWSENAWSNNENSLWIRDAAIATAYTTYFDSVWATARLATPNP